MTTFLKSLALAKASLILSLLSLTTSVAMFVAFVLNASIGLADLSFSKLLISFRKGKSAVVSVFFSVFCVEVSVCVVVSTVVSTFSF